MKKRYILAIIFGVLVFATAIAIFGFSSETGDKSGGRSDKVIDFIANIIIRDYDEMTPAQKAQIIRKFAYPVRKSAHIAEYAILSAFIAVFVWVFTSKWYYTITIPSVFSFLFAMCDELILQRSTSGRSGQFSDVLIDLIGIVLGTLAVYLFMRFYWRGARLKSDANKNS